MAELTIPPVDVVELKQLKLIGAVTQFRRLPPYFD